jgi:hypothetical protein
MFLAIFDYLAAVYNVYASSAISVQSSVRNFVGGIFCLFGLKMYENLGIVRAGYLIASVSSGLAFVPIVLVFFGEKIRQRSPYLVQTHHVR